MSESDGAATMSESEFTAVENRKTRRLNKRARTATSSPVYMTAAQIVANGNGASSNNTLQATGPVAPTASHLAGQNKKANDRIVMVGRSTTSRMTAAVKLTTPKEVFRISNIDGAFTEKDMEDYLEFIGVHVQTCFDRTPLVARKKNNKVFRVCILSIDKDKLLSENNWSRGIIIQKWIFNTGKDARGQGGDVPPPQADLTSQTAGDATLLNSPPPPPDGARGGTSQDHSMDEGGPFVLATAAEEDSAPPSRQQRVERIVSDGEVD